MSEESNFAVSIVWDIWTASTVTSLTHNYFCLEPQQLHPTSNVNASDRSFYLANKAIEVSRVDDSCGIDLVEVYSNDDNISGANKSDQLMVGDSIIKLSNYERSIDVTGLNYDNTINAFKQFSDDNTFTLTVQ